MWDENTTITVPQHKLQQQRMVSDSHSVISFSNSKLYYKVHNYILLLKNN